MPLLANKKVASCKWVFKLKKNLDGSVSRYKACLVAKGFHQQLGLDYFDTFSLAVKSATIRFVLTIALSHALCLRQLNINNVFLNGEDIYMEQPPGFQKLDGSSHMVCKLHKSLCGLKQAPKAWYDRLKTFLTSIGIVYSKSNNSLFL